MIERCVPMVLFVVIAGCAPWSGDDPVRVDFLDTGYLVDDTVLVTAAELRAYFADRRARQVRFVPSPAGTDARIAEAAAAVRDAGVSVDR